MRILVVNDDGINACGIHELALALKSAGHELLIFAPIENQSAVGHGLTLRRCLYVEPVSLEGLEEVRTFSVNGTPVDCVRLALGNFDFEPDLIVSGINQAPNLGTDAVYSGTISAALEGSMIGYKAIAVSKDTFSNDFMSDAGKYFVSLLPELISIIEHGTGVLSVNIPSTPISKYKGIRVGRLALQDYELRYIETIDAEGNTAYSVTSKKLTECAECEDTDERYMRDGYVVVTPLTYDLTAYDCFGMVKKLCERDFL